MTVGNASGVVLFYLMNGYQITDSDLLSWQQKCLIFYEAIAKVVYLGQRLDLWASGPGFLIKYGILNSYFSAIHY